MARFATGVTVITTTDGDGQPVGTTANAVCSVSLTPPLVLVCFNRDSLTYAEARTGGVFAINVLAASQRSLADGFARKGPTDVWRHVTLSTALTGAPLLDGCAAALDCRLERIVSAGDHEIIIGHVVATRILPAAPAPLVFYDGRYAERGQGDVRNPQGTVGP